MKILDKPPEVLYSRNRLRLKYFFPEENFSTTLNSTNLEDNNFLMPVNKLRHCKLPQLRILCPCHCYKTLDEKLFCQPTPIWDFLVSAKTHEKPHEFSTFWVLLAYILIFALQIVSRKIRKIWVQASNFA